MITCLGHILLTDSLSERKARSLKVLVPTNSINTIRAKTCQEHEGYFAAYTIILYAYDRELTSYMCMLFNDF